MSDDICRTCPRSIVITHQFGDISVICQCQYKKNGKCACLDEKDAEALGFTNQGNEE